MVTEHRKMSEMEEKRIRTPYTTSVCHVQRFATPLTSRKTEPPLVFCIRFVSSHQSRYLMTPTFMQCLDSSQLQLQTKPDESRQSQNIAEQHRNEGACLHFNNRQHRSIASRHPQNHHPRENLNFLRACALSRLD